MKHAKHTLQADDAIDLALDAPRPPPGIDEIREALNRFAAARPTYNYCGICGHVPHGVPSEPNRAPLRFWCPDDGWKVGSLCRFCAEEALPRKPHPRDYAYGTTNGVAHDIDTDQDPLLAIE